jgi:hypothetical protein
MLKSGYHSDTIKQISADERLKIFGHLVDAQYGHTVTQEARKDHGHRFHWYLNSSSKGGVNAASSKNQNRAGSIPVPKEADLWERVADLDHIAAIAPAGRVTWTLHEGESINTKRALFWCASPTADQEWRRLKPSICP